MAGKAAILVRGERAGCWAAAAPAAARATTPRAAPSPRTRRLPTPPEWGPPPAHIFTSWYSPQTIPQPVFRPSAYSRLAAPYGGPAPFFAAPPALSAGMGDASSLGRALYGGPIFLEAAAGSGSRGRLRGNAAAAAAAAARRAAAAAAAPAEAAASGGDLGGAGAPSTLLRGGRRKRQQ
jgi:hypothetical protein